MVFLDHPGSANVILQAIGRIYRIAQQQAQLIWIVVGDHTYDQCLQYRAAKKMIAQIADQGTITPSEEQLTKRISKKDSKITTRIDFE